MYQTESHIRTRCIEALKAKRRTDKGDVDVDRVTAELATPSYTAWINARIEDARRAKRLVTERQFADVRARRELAVGDKVRYLGPERILTLPSGQSGLQKAGAVGHITKAERHGSRLIFTFMPLIPKVTLEAAANGLDVQVFSVTTTDWIEYERIE